MPTIVPSTNYVVGEIMDVDLGNGQTVKAVVPSMASAAFGSPSDAEWDGVSADATVISLLKKIATNTTPP